MPQEVLRGHRRTRVERALDYVPGVGKQNDFGAQNLALYSVRGFATQDIFFNGFNIARATTARRTPERAVHRGAQGTERGTLWTQRSRRHINILTKQPVALPSSRWARWSGFRHGATTVDAAGALNEEGTVLYRFNGALARQDSFRDFVDGDRVLVAPVVSW